MNSNNMRASNIRKYSHKILSKAIFNYCPYKDLLKIPRKTPTYEEWTEDSNKGLSLNAKPYQIVSK